MKTLDIRSISTIRFSGRFDAVQPGFPMMWTGASAEMRVQASALWVRIECAYQAYRPYVSFEVDGLKAQTLSPLPGVHWYGVMVGMDATLAHTVRITLETQAFPGTWVDLLALRTDGVFLPLPARKRRIEFIGDSITSGEGMRGPKAFMEWVPMCFSATDAYTRMVSDRLNAQVQIISQSGWGVVCGWNNDPSMTLPSVYDAICGPAARGIPDHLAHGGPKPYDFSFDPDTVVVNLGTNDSGGLANPPFTDPVSGITYHLTIEDLPRFEEACYQFILHLHARNPHAKLLWAYGVAGGEAMAASIQRAVARAQAAELSVAYLALPDAATLRGGIGSRDHPGSNAHRRMAELIVRAIR